MRLVEDAIRVHLGLRMALALIAVAIFGKLLGAGAGAWLAGYSPLESMQLGAGMVSRGEVGLIVASVGAGAGLISQANLSAVVSMVVISTLVTPPMLRYLFQLQKTNPEVDTANQVIKSALHLVT